MSKSLTSARATHLDSSSSSKEATVLLEKLVDVFNVSFIERRASERD